MSSAKASVHLSHLFHPTPLVLIHIRDLLLYIHCMSSFSSFYVYCIQCIQCFISVLYVFIDMCAFDTYNNDYLLTYLLTYILIYTVFHKKTTRYLIVHNFGKC